MIGRKIKELWNKLFKKEQSIEEKKEENKVVEEAIKDIINEMPDNEESSSEEESDNDNTEEDNKEESKSSHNIKGKYTKEVTFKRSGKPVKAIIKVKLSKKEIKEKKLKYKIIKNYKLFIKEDYFMMSGLETYFRMKKIIDQEIKLINRGNPDDPDNQPSTYSELFDDLQHIKSEIRINVAERKNAYNINFEWEEKEDTYENAINDLKKVEKVFDEYVDELNKIKAKLDSAISKAEKDAENFTTYPQEQYNSILCNAANFDCENYKSILMVIIDLTHKILSEDGYIILEEGRLNEIICKPIMDKAHEILKNYGKL